LCDKSCILWKDSCHGNGASYGGFIAIPFIVMGVLELRKLLKQDREYLPLLGVCGAFIFILSALKLPSVTGSCSHPTGTGLSVMCFKPYITAVIGFVVLLFQALLPRAWRPVNAWGKHGFDGNRRPDCRVPGLQTA